MQLKGLHCNNLAGLDATIPLGVMTAVTGPSGSGKSSLVSLALVELVAAALGGDSATDADAASGEPAEMLEAVLPGLTADRAHAALATPAARARRYDAGRFSFNLSKGRCATCEGEGFVSVELLFMPSVYAPCPACQGGRYNPETLQVRLRGRTIAGVLARRGGRLLHRAFSTAAPA